MTPEDQQFSFSCGLYPSPSDPMGHLQMSHGHSQCCAVLAGAQSLLAESS